MRFRQIHLDFHTSEKIAGIGSKFSKEQFQAALKAGHVDSITVFSKCHHGWAYHPSKANDMHPGLDFDLLKAQIEAAHEIGVKTPVYLSAGMDEKYVQTHRGYAVRQQDESTVWPSNFMQPGFHRLCMNTPYLDYLLAQIKEVCENYDADGIFLDIVGVIPCYCQNCISTMLAEGKSPENRKDVIDLAERVYANYTKRVRETIDSVKPGLPVFHNGGHIRRGKRSIAFANSHLELESLPTGGWGYDHFPVSAGYARSLGMDFLGMTGKFHTSWGEFGGFKHPNALRYETALSMANGARSSIGDQMHPLGAMDMATYELIGAAYKEIEEKESYVDGAHNLIDIAVLAGEAIRNYYAGLKFSSGVSTKTGPSEAGCARILLEGKYQFDYIDAEADFDNYKVLILPDESQLDETLAAKIKAFTAKGGKVLASGKSATDEEGKFLLDFGCDYKGENEFRPDYLRPGFELKSLGNSAFVMYAQGYDVEMKDGKVHGYRENPYFNRAREHFCSHKHTPNNPDTIKPAIVEGKDGIYIGWDIFGEYAEMGSLIAKETVLGVLKCLLPDPVVKTNLPAQGVVTIMEKENTNIVHLLYASPVKRGKGVEIIEDIVPVYDVEAWAKTNGKEVKRTYLAPQETEIPFTVEDGYVGFKVDKLECHQMVVVEYK